MADELNLSISATYSKEGVTLDKTFNAPTDVAGNTPLSTVQNIGTVDETLVVGDISTAGYLIAHNQEALVTLTTPDAPAADVQGTPASTHYTYKLVALQTDGAYSAASSGTVVTTGAATLNMTDFIRLTWTDEEAATGGYDIYRTASAGTPSSTGKIGHVAFGVEQFDDTGLAGDSGTAPSTGADNTILLGANGTSYPNKLKGGEFMLARWNGAIHAKGNTVACDLEYMIIPD